MKHEEHVPTGPERDIAPEAASSPEHGSHPVTTAEDGVADDRAPSSESAHDGEADTAGTHDDSGPAGGVTDSTDAGPVGGPYAFEPEGGEPGVGDPGPYPGLTPSVDPGHAGGPNPAEGGRTDRDALDDDGDRLAPQGSGPAGTDGTAGTTGAAAGATSLAAATDGPRAGWAPTAPGEDAQYRRDRTQRKRTRPLLFALAAVVVVLALLTWLLVSLFGGSEDEDLVDPSSLATGECLADFTVITEDAQLVDCSEPHNAQLLASESYGDDDAFPGREQLAARAEAECSEASEAIDPDVVTEDLEVTLLRATPTEGTWADGDRRVDCFAVLENGATLDRNMLLP